MTSSNQNILMQCKEIKELLVNDKKHFSNHDIDEIEKSNQKKLSLLASLKEFSTSVQSIQPETFQELQSELLECYRSLAINTHIVYSQLQHIKTTWDNLTNFQSNSHYLYDGKGSLNK